MLEYIGLTTCVVVALAAIYWLCNASDHPKVVPFVYGLFMVLVSNACYDYHKQVTELSELVPPEIEMLHDVDYSFMRTSEINDSLLLLVMKYYNVSDPEYVLAQAKLESGNFTSEVFKKYNNFLGLYNSKLHDYFIFESWQDCVKGYVNSVQYKKLPNEGHLAFLQRIKYAEDPAYINKISTLVKQ